MKLIQELLMENDNNILDFAIGWLTKIRTSYDSIIKNVDDAEDKTWKSLMYNHTRSINSFLDQSHPMNKKVISVLYSLSKGLLSAVEDSSKTKDGKISVKDISKLFVSEVIFELGYMKHRGHLDDNELNFSKNITVYEMFNEIEKWIKTTAAKAQSYK